MSNKNHGKTCCMLKRYSHMERPNVRLKGVLFCGQLQCYCGRQCKNNINHCIILPNLNTTHDVANKAMYMIADICLTVAFKGQCNISYLTLFRNLFHNCQILSYETTLNKIPYFYIVKKLYTCSFHITSTFSSASAVSTKLQVVTNAPNC